MKAATVIGTRPEIIKMAPLIPILDREYEHHFIFSSQHYSSNMVEIFLEEMDLRRPDTLLHVNSSDRDRLQQAIADELSKIQPDLLLVYGDTNSTIAAARSKPAGCKLCHIEAGLRSFDSRMPEEANRIETDRLSDILFAPTGLAKYFLMDYEGYNESAIDVVGNLVVDAYRRNRAGIKAVSLPDGLVEGEYYLLTLHRTENVDDRDRLKAILESIDRIEKTVVFPVHPRTRERMSSFGLEFPDCLKVVEPLGYFSFMALLDRCDVVISDSGGVQEEAITAGVPCVTIRDNTERMETVFLGANTLYDADHRRDLADVVADMSGRRKSIGELRNPYGSGNTADTIIGCLKERMG